MGNVVELEGSGRRRRRRKPSKTAFVLGGGGFTGGVYEIGALRALDLLAVDRTVNQFDVYVGTSAGALIAALAANGVTPEQMMRVVNDQVPQPFSDVRWTRCCARTTASSWGAGLRLPLALAGIAREVGRTLPGSLRSISRSRWPISCLRASIRVRGSRSTCARRSRTGSHRRLPRAACELYLAATDLDTCERIVLGGAGWDDLRSPRPCGPRRRCRWSTSRRFKDRELVDGGIVSTTNLDIAVEAGELIVVVNPLVPYVNDFTKEIPTLFGTRTRRVSDMGFPKIGYQTFKLLAYQRLHEVARTGRSATRASTSS